MDDAWNVFLPWLESVEPLLSHRRLRNLGEGVFEQLVGAGLLRPAANADRVACPACSDGHVEEVLVRDGPNGSCGFFIRCPQSLRVEVAPADMRRWTVDADALARALATALPKGTCRSLDPGRVWRLGHIDHDGGSHEMVFLRGAGWSRPPAKGTLGAGRSVVFVGCHPPATDLWGERVAAVVSLADIANLDGGRIAIDRAALSVALSSQFGSASPAEFLFRRRGEQWELAFEGKPTLMKDTVGLAYIARLLGEPNRDVPVAELFAIRAGIDARVAGGSSGEMLDPVAMQQYRRRLEELTEELEEAQDHNDIGRIEQLQGDRDRLAAEIGRATGLGGRSRNADDVDRVRKSVTMAVTRDIERIGLEHAPLSTHLTLCISSGRFFRYCPERPIDWLL